ncbi:hypothetical protein T484DRAFT_1810532, partial [Baffinella frigidus]
MRAAAAEWLRQSLEQAEALHDRAAKRVAEKTSDFAAQAEALHDRASKKVAEKTSDLAAQWATEVDALKFGPLPTPPERDASEPPARPAPSPAAASANSHAWRGLDIGAASEASTATREGAGSDVSEQQQTCPSVSSNGGGWSSARSATSPAGAADPWAIVPHLLDLLPPRVACAASPLRRSAAAQKKWQWLSKRLVTRLLGTTAARNLHLSGGQPRSSAATNKDPPPESSGADAIFAQALLLGDNLDSIVGRVAEAAVAQRMPFPDIPTQGAASAVPPGGPPGGAITGKDDAIEALKLRLLMPDGLPLATSRSSE